MGMGVTEFIGQYDIKKRIKTDFPNPGSSVEANIRVPHKAYNHALLGQAFDYLIRIWLETKCETIHDPHKTISNVSTDWLSLVSYSGLSYDGTNDFDENQFRKSQQNQKYKKSYERARKKHQHFTKTGLNVNDAIDASLVYSGLDYDVGFDNGPLHANSFEKDIVTELQDLFHVLREQKTLIGGSVIISPVFGRRSFILEGHGDFIIDDMLVDVKVTENPTFKPRYWRQLLTYYILNHNHREITHAGIDDYGSDVDHPELSKVGIYFARFGKLQIIDMNNYLQPLEKYNKLRAFINDRAMKINHDKRRNYKKYYELLTEPYDFEDQKTFDDF